MGNAVFRVFEYSTGYVLKHVKSGQERWLGDGVDTLFDRNGRALTPGTERFRLTWERVLNENPDETMEAYFPELHKKENVDA